jgi:hypothetical protein
MVFVVLAALCALVGVLIAAFRESTSYVDAIAWAMWIGGAAVVLLAGMSGSPAARAEDSRVVVGGRFVQGSNIPQPQSPFILIPAGLLVTGLGVLLYLIA